MRIRIKRIYDGVEPADGNRILVDRLWPRGINKEDAKLAYWARDVAPSNELRRWYGHDPSRWQAFKKRYFAELDANPEGVNTLREHLGTRATFLFGAKEPDMNNANALKEYVETRLR